MSLRQHVALVRTVCELVATLVAFLILMFALPLSHSWDVRVTMWAQHAVPSLDVPASILVHLGNVEVCVPAVAGGAAFFLFRNRRGGIALLSLAALMTIGSLLVFALQTWIVSVGPVSALQRKGFDLGLRLTKGPETFPFAHAVRSLLPSTPYSFPSGHSVRAVLLARTILRTRPWLAGMVVLGMTAALVYLGAHWLSDVFGGLCLGWALIATATLTGLTRNP